MKLLILGGSELQLPAIFEAKKLGLFVIVADYDDKCVGKEYSDIFECVSTIDTEGILEISKKHNIDGIITIASDRPMLSVAKVANTLGLKSISYESAINTTNKFKMRDVLKSNGIVVPKYSSFEKSTNAYSYFKSIEKDMICKPSDSSGSRGISFIEKGISYDIFRCFFNNSLQHSLEGKVVIEEYMEGPEVSVESFTIDGETTVISITDKLTTGKPNFVELGHSEPSELSIKKQNEIIDLTKKSIEAVGISNGPSHIEVIYTYEGPRIVEIGPRMGGDNISTSLVPLTTGINMVELTIKNTLNIPFSLKKVKQRSAAIKYFNFKEGVVKSVKNNIPKNRPNYLMKLELEIETGMTVKSIRSSRDRLGYVICTGETPEVAMNRCEYIISLVDVEYIGEQL